MSPGNIESMGQNTARDRLAPSRGPFFPHPGVRRFFGAVQIMHIFFNISYFLKITVNTLIEDIFLYNIILRDLCYREPVIFKMPFSLRGAVMPQATLYTTWQQVVG